MGKARRLSGTPWHIEKLKSVDGVRRHKTRCIYYKSYCNGCVVLAGPCNGSSHCSFYDENFDHVDFKPSSSHVKDTRKEKTQSDTKKKNKNVTILHLSDKTDLCPKCKKDNRKSKLTVRDKCRHQVQIFARMCSCGTIYLTKSDYNNLKNKTQFNIIKGKH